MNQKTFYCVTNGGPGAHNSNYRLLKAACKARGVVFVELPMPSNAYAYSEVPGLNTHSGLYRINVDKRCSQYAFALSRSNPHLKTWYTENYIAPSPAWGRQIVSESHTSPVVPTLYGVTAETTPDLLKKINTNFGGFPVIAKLTGESHGRGVALIDSAHSLQTLLPHLADGSQLVLRKFIAEATHYRLVVVGDTCVSSIRYLPQDGDIRTNATTTPRVEPADVPQEMRELAIKVVSERGLAFGGVDLLVDTAGNTYVAEVNTPCNFSRNQHCTGDDIAGAIVDYLCDLATSPQ